MTCKYCAEEIEYVPVNGIRFDYRHKDYPGSYYCCDMKVAEPLDPPQEKLNA